MDSREGSSLPPSLSAAQNMMVGPISYPTSMAQAGNNNASSMINPNSTTAEMISATSRFPFNSAPKPLDYDGSSSGFKSGGFNVDSGKKKRGRPRKYSPDGGGGGSIALGLTPTPSSMGQGDSSGTPSSEPTVKKHRGRPPGSGKKQMDALGAGGVGFTPHVILVKPGEDIASKIMAFSQQGPRTVCILAASGAVSNVNLRQPAMSGGSMAYEGRYEIISLSGSFLLSENNGTRSRTGDLSVSLAGLDGRVIGGGVIGTLTASSPVQVIVGSFIADGKKSNSNALKSGSSSTPPQMINFSAQVLPAAASPSSQGASSDSSDGNGSHPFNRAPGIYSTSNQQIHNMQMYQLWAGQTQQ